LPIRKEGWSVSFLIFARIVFPKNITTQFGNMLSSSLMIEQRLFLINQRATQALFSLTLLHVVKLGALLNRNASIEQHPIGGLVHAPCTVELSPTELVQLSSRIHLFRRFGVCPPITSTGITLFGLSPAARWDSGLKLREITLRLYMLVLSRWPFAATNG
jgi:hypothetical protein